MIDKPFRTVLKTEQNHLDKYIFRGKNINVSKTPFNEFSSMDGNCYWCLDITGNHNNGSRWGLRGIIFMILTSDWLWKEAPLTS